MQYLLNITINLALYLSLPLFIRFVLLRKPIERKWIVICILILLFITFSLIINIGRNQKQQQIAQELGMQYKPSTHMFGAPLLYSAMVLSYSILRKRRKKKYYDQKTFKQYVILFGLAEKFTHKELQETYRDLTQVWHPDKYAYSDRLQEKATKQLQEITEGYEFLKAVLEEDVPFSSFDSNAKAEQGRSRTESNNEAKKEGKMPLAEHNTCGQNADSELPESIKGWSWGGFLIAPLWSVFNGTWIGLLACIPYLGLIMNVTLGFKGREWAWRNKNWESVEHFQRVQRNWTIMSFALIGMGIFMATISSQMQDSTEKEAINAVTQSAKGSVATNTSPPQTHIQQKKTPHYNTASSSVSEISPQLTVCQNTYGRKIYTANGRCPNKYSPVNNQDINISSRRISIDFDKICLFNVFRLISEITSVDFEITKNLEFIECTMEAKDEPINSIFKRILFDHNLYAEFSNESINIGSIKSVQKIRMNDDNINFRKISNATCYIVLKNKKSYRNFLVTQKNNQSIMISKDGVRMNIPHSYIHTIRDCWR